jgi:hypothetical protein
LRANRLLPRCRRTLNSSAVANHNTPTLNQGIYPVEERKAMRSPDKNHDYDIYFDPFRRISLILILNFRCRDRKTMRDMSLPALFTRLIVSASRAL